MVEWKPLKSIVKSISTGLNPRQNFILNEENASLYYVTVKEITTNKVVFSDSTDKITEKARKVINNRSKLSEGDVLFSGIGTIGKVAYVDIPTNNWDCSESVFIIKPIESKTMGKFLSYVLISDITIRQYERGAAGAIMKGVRKATLENIQIPIPSLSEQQRIVETLDTFTASIANLQEQIALRRKQYEHYRDQLLDLEGKEEVEMISLDIVCHIGDGLHGTPIYDENGDYFFINGNNLYNGHIILKPDTKKVSEEMFNKYGIKLDTTSILMSINGTIGNIAIYKDEKIVLGKSAAFFKVKDINKLHYKYLYYYLQTTKANNYYESSLTGSTIKNLGLKALRTFIIPLPPLSEQSRIVSILDSFEASIANFEEQLALRQKQYEYYREKLLTFN